MTYTDVVPKTPSAYQKGALAELRAGRYAQAWLKFRGLYRQDDSSPFHIWGMAISAQEAGKLADAADEVAAKAIPVRQKEIEQGLGRTPPQGTARHIVAFNLVRGMMAATGNRPPLSPRADYWSSTLFLKPLPSGVRNREMIILYSGAMYVMLERGKTRKWLAEYVKGHPNDARCRLLLANSYSQGAVRMWDRGKEVPVPPEEKADFTLAKEHTLAAARIEPSWAEAQYIAGLKCAADAPDKARQYLARYLELDPHPSKRRLAVITQYMKTGKWGPPPPG